MATDWRSLTSKRPGGTNAQHKRASTGKRGKANKLKRVRNSPELREFFEANDYDPAESLLHYRNWLTVEANNAEQQHEELRRELDVEDRRRFPIVSKEEFRLREKCAEVDEALLVFLYPRKKAIEVKGRLGLSWLDVLNQAGITDEG